MSVELIRCLGDELRDHLQDVARLRIRVFREFPYLYDGDMEYETWYLGNLTRSPNAVVVLALDEGRVVGASTAMPLRDENADFQKPFLAAGWDLGRIFYLAESVLAPEYRGCGLGVRFFEEREAHARELGGFETLTFCAIERPENHPRRPADYAPLNRFWTKRGYTRHPELTTEFSWKDLDEEGQSPKTLVYWLKEAAG